uniref:Putative secreted protein n=1 Tax=Ixodes ricinus TaxID=34613 RepID=A0A6B0TT97_IXORI
MWRPARTRWTLPAPCWSTGPALGRSPELASPRSTWPLRRDTPIWLPSSWSMAPNATPRQRTASPPCTCAPKKTE